MEERHTRGTAGHWQLVAQRLQYGSCACVRACVRALLMAPLSWQRDSRGEEGPAEERRGRQRGHGESEPDEVGVLHVLELLEVVDADEVALRHDDQPAASMQEV